MTYVEYCRMKCFSKINNSDTPTKSETEHQKRMSILAKRSRKDSDCKQPSFYDRVASGEGDKEYKASLESCKKNEGIECKGEAASNAEDAVSISRKTCKTR